MRRYCLICVSRPGISRVSCLVTHTHTQTHTNTSNKSNSIKFVYETMKCAHMSIGSRGSCNYDDSSNTWDSSEAAAPHLHNMFQSTQFIEWIRLRFFDWESECGSDAFESDHKLGLDLIGIDGKQLSVPPISPSFQSPSRHLERFKKYRNGKKKRNDEDKRRRRRKSWNAIH